MNMTGYMNTININGYMNNMNTWLADHHFNATKFYFPVIDSA